MKTFFTIFLIFFTTVAHTQDLQVYIGTYTRGASKGIYRATLNLQSGALSNASLVAEVENPSFLALSENQQQLYTVVESGKFMGANGGGLVGYQINQDGSLQMLNSMNTAGGAPCHLSVADRSVLVANYSGGNVAAFLTDANGALKSRTKVVQHQGSSINPRRQKGPHAHAINVYGEGKYAAAADLGTDSVFIYALNAKTAELTVASEIKLQPGSGPRHLAFHPSEKYAYVINEMTRTVAAFKLNSPTEWEPILYTSTLPKGAQPNGSTAEIHMHPSGKFLYGSNRGHDTIVVYRVDESTGGLTWVENEPIQGAVPRNFNITPDGEYLLTAGQKSDTVAVFKVNLDTGELDYINQKISVPSPVCLVFR